MGPKIALQVLSKLTPDQLCVAVNMKDRTVFSGINGIGPKIIDRIFAELKDRAFINNFEKYFPKGEGNASIGEFKNMKNDAISVFINLVINKSEPFVLASNIIAEFSEYNLNEIIKSALNKMTMR